MYGKLGNWPSYSKDEIKAVTEVLESGLVNRWTGNKTELFEKGFTETIGSKYGLAVSNGSHALKLAYEGLRLEKESEILVTSRSFVATASEIVNAGHCPVFVDVDTNNGNMLTEDMEKYVTKKTKAIAVVHLNGIPADIKKIKEFAESYDLKVVEDCAQSHGAMVNDEGIWRSVGTIGDIGTWSFCQDKIMTLGGEGGFIATDNKKVEEVIWSLKDHGKNREKLYENTDAGYKYIHDTIGSNYRMTEMQAAIGLRQVILLEEWLEKRKYNAEFIIENLREFDQIRLPRIEENMKPSWYKLNVFIEPEHFKADWSRDRLIMEIKSRGYPALQGSCPEIYRETAFRRYVKEDFCLKNARKLARESLTFLVHPTITNDQINTYGDIISATIRKALK